MLVKKLDERRVKLGIESNVKKDGLEFSDLNDNGVVTLKPVQWIVEWRSQRN